MNITIRTTKGTIDQPCYRVPGVPGLVVHRPVGGARGWRLSHHSSGLAVNGLAYRTRAEAIDAGRTVGPLADWTNLPIDDLPAMRELGRRVVAALRGESLHSDAPVREEDVVIRTGNGDILDDLLPEGWDHDGMGMDSLLICPHGFTIEMDGVCPEGCVSPLRTAGLI